MRAGGRTETTIATYEPYLQRLLTALGPIPLEQVRPHHLEQVIISLGMGDTALSPVTLNKVRSIFRNFFHWARSAGYTSQDPGRGLLSGRGESLPTRPLFPEELQRLLHTIRSSGDRFALRDAALFATYAYTGARRTEVVHLCVADFDAAGRFLRFRCTKNGGSRRCPVPTPLHNALCAYLASRLRPLASEPLFTAGSGTRPLSERQVNHRFAKWRTLAGINEEATLHSLRSGFATTVHHSTGDVALVGHLLGHKDLRSTLRYIRMDEQVVQSTVERVFSADLGSNRP